MEPRYNEVLGTMKITLLYQVSHYIRAVAYAGFVQGGGFNHAGPEKADGGGGDSDTFFFFFLCVCVIYIIG